MSEAPASSGSAGDPQSVALRHWLGWVQTAVGLVAGIYLVIFVTGVLFRPWSPIGRGQEGVVAILAGVAFALVRRHPRLAASMVLAAIWAEATLTILETGALLSTAILAFPALVIAAGLLLGNRWSLSVAALSVLVLWFGLWVRRSFTGELPPVVDDWYTLVVLACVLPGVAVLTRGTLRSYVAALRSAEQAGRRYAALFQSSPDGVVVLDGHGRIEELNPAAAQLLGAPSAALHGDAFLEVLQRAGAAETPDLAAARPGAPLQVEVTSGGVQRLLEITARAELERDTGGDRTLLGLRDVSQRRRIEERLGHSQRLEMMGQLAGGVAHDFNNLLTAVGGNAAMLSEHPDPLVRELASDIQTAGLHGSALVRQLLAFARREVRRVERVDLAEAISGMSALLRRVLPETHRLATACQGAPVVAADRAQLEQVILNLVTNARDAMPAGGTITLGGRALSSGEAGALGSGLSADGQAMLEVADQGAGISPEVQARMFEPFFTTKPRGKGTGLGLATVHGIVAQSGGDIAVRSVPGQGTRFRVFLPLASPEAIPAPPPPRHDAPGGSERILLVEDDPIVRALIRRTLDRAGYRVAEAAGAGSALALAASGPAPDLLLTDVGIPDASGPELAARLHRRWPGLRVLYMSGYWSEGEAGEERLDPALNLVRKPFGREELLQRIRAALDAPPPAAAT